MNDYLLRQKYKRLKLKVSKIANELVEVNDIHDEVILNMKQTLLINDSIVMNKVLDDIKATNDKNINEISNEVIPMINKKI